jgi:SsrA-binding protein
MEIKNKKANFDYFIEDTIECGIELKGTEIKSLRKGSGDLKDTFAIIKNGEV